MKNGFQIIRPILDGEATSKNPRFEAIGRISSMFFADLQQEVYQIELEKDCDLSEVLIVLSSGNLAASETGMTNREEEVA